MNAKLEKSLKNIKKKVSKIVPKTLKNRDLTRDSKRVTINVRQPVYSNDKSRFFKKAWEVEKKQLYFD